MYRANRHLLQFSFIPVLLCLYSCDHDNRGDGVSIESTSKGDNSVATAHQVWEEIAPFYGNSESNKHRLQLRLANPCLRSNCYALLTEKTHAQHLSLEEQYRLATMLKYLVSCSSSGEWAEIGTIHMACTNHPSAYLQLLSAFQPYVLETMHALTYTSGFVAESRTTEGTVTNEVVREKARWILKEFTKHDFGFDYCRWTNWWYSEAINMDYDYINWQYKDSAVKSATREETPESRNISGDTRNQ